jgi:hypothetical protein
MPCCIIWKKLITIMMQAVSTDEMSANFYQTMQYNIPKDRRHNGEAVAFMMMPALALMMAAARTSETLVNFYQTTWCYKP